MEEVKICALCKNEIKEKDDYCCLTDYVKGKFLEEKFYHTMCFNLRIKSPNTKQEEIQNVVLSLANRANTLLSKHFGEEEVYELK